MPYRNSRSKEAYSQQLVSLLKVAVLMGLFVGCLWFVLFLLTRQWHLAYAVALLAVAILPCWMIGIRGYFSAGLMLAQLVCTIFVVLFSLLFDVSNGAAPRSTHVFLLVIAFAGYINYRRKDDWYQALLIVLSLSAFVVLSSTNYAIPTGYLMPDEIRTYSAWSNYIVATAMLGGGLAFMNLEVSRDAKLGRELRLALWNEELELFYQPQVGYGGRISGAEALIRWRHPKRGYIPPSEFIPVAERLGLMPKVGEWVIAQACEKLSDWKDRPVLSGLTLSINVSADQFLTPDFERIISECCRKFNVDERKLKLELTESVLLTNVENVISKMETLKGAGFDISLDDFGTGYSSLSYLRRLPLSELKIDRSFVAGVLRDDKDAELARNIVRLGRALNLSVLAEGIETTEQFKFMQQCGCDAFQGFFFGKPVAADEFERSALITAVHG
jgi:EAL domain-containing protein (putative c-di-GMP-specific phosphodiesterase class I)